jgi:hypothetical protein
MAKYKKTPLNKSFLCVKAFIYIIVAKVLLLIARLVSVFRWLSET